MRNLRRKHPICPDCKKPNRAVFMYCLSCEQKNHQYLIYYRVRSRLVKEGKWIPKHPEKRNVGARPLPSAAGEKALKSEVVT